MAMAKTKTKMDKNRQRWKTKEKGQWIGDNENNLQIFQMTVRRTTGTM